MNSPWLRMCCALLLALLWLVPAAAQDVVPKLPPLPRPQPPLVRPETPLTVITNPELPPRPRTTSDLETSEQPAAAAVIDLKNRIVIELDDGLVTIDLRADLAPEHIARIKQLIRQDFYDGLLFHRVVSGFVAQTGDPTGTGMGGSDLPDLKAEFSEERFLRGTVGMARGEDTDSANSQFFILLGDAPWLEGEHTVIGKVESGLELIDGLKTGTRPENGLVRNPDKIVALRIAGDVEDRRLLAIATNGSAIAAANVAANRAAAAEIAAEEAEAAARYADETRLTAALADDEVASKTAAEEQAQFAVQDAMTIRSRAVAALGLSRNRLARAQDRLAAAEVQLAQLSENEAQTVGAQSDAEAALDAAKSVAEDAEHAFLQALEQSDAAVSRSEQASAA
ncbi:MAG: peptidylprolyl isomerase, partial [Hyphomicrobiales bacterium]